MLIHQIMLNSLKSDADKLDIDKLINLAKNKRY